MLSGWWKSHTSGFTLSTLKYSSLNVNLNGTWAKKKQFSGVIFLALA